MEINKGFKAKLLNLNDSEKNHLDQIFGINRLVWNLCLAYKKELYETYKRRNPCIDVKEEKKLINKLGNCNQLQLELAQKRVIEIEGYDFILTCPAKAVQQCIRKLDDTYKKFYKGKGGFPKFKKKAGFNSIHLDSCGKVEKVNKKHIKIITNGMSFIIKNPIRGNKKIFESETNICSITLSKRPNGVYYVSVNYSYKTDEVQKVKVNKAVGIDRGITTTAMCSDGQSFNIEPMLKINKRIKFQQRRLSKKKKGSNNRNKVRIKLAKLHQKKSNIKKDFNHKLSNYLVKSQDYIVLEDLKVKNMTKSAKGTVKNPGSMVKQKSGLNRSILENNWGQLLSFIKYKCDWYGKNIALVPPKDTSIKCSECKHIDKNNRKGKLFKCLNCSHKMDADLNAAINILEAGLALLACGEIELSNSMKQELETILS